MIVKLQWKPKKKDSKRFPKSGGWGYAVFNYEAASDKFTADPKASQTADTRAIRP